MTDDKKPASRPLYRPSRPPAAQPASSPRVPPPTLPPAPEVPKLAPPVDEDQADEMLIAAVPRELLRGDDTSPNVERRDPVSVEIPIDESLSKFAAARALSERPPPEEVVTGAKDPSERVPEGDRLAKLLEESPSDGEAIDTLLQTELPNAVRERLLRNARTGLVNAVQARPADVANVKRLVKVARALGDDSLQQAALGALLSVGAADAKAEQEFAQLGSRRGRTPQIAVNPAMLREILAPGDEGPIADLFVLLGATLAEALGPSLQGYGVGRRNRVDPRSGLALRNEIASWAGAFGVREFDMYVGGQDPLGVQGIPGEPPAIVVGSGVNAPLTPLTRALVAREVLGIVRGTTVARSRDDITIAAVVVASCRLAEVPIEHRPYAVLAEVERLIGRAMARRTRKSIVNACRAIASAGLEARGWGRRALFSQDRVAIIASGDCSVVLSEVLGVSIERLGQAVKGSVRAEELLRFVLSPQYMVIRRALGLEGVS
jgi:hypothetical protein